MQYSSSYAHRIIFTLHAVQTDSELQKGFLKSVCSVLRCRFTHTYHFSNIPTALIRLPLRVSFLSMYGNNADSFDDRFKTENKKNLAKD